MPSPAVCTVRLTDLSVLQRRPMEKERAAFAAYLGRGAKPEAAVEDVIWVLLNSSEFRFNH